MKVTLKIEGITCNGCVKTIENHLKKKECKQINVSSVLGEASFTINEHDKAKEIAKSLSKIGYPAVEKHNINTTTKKSWDALTIKLLISTFFTIPLLLHMIVSENSLLNNPFVQLGLCIPVFTIGVLHFGKSAWGSIKEKYANMDVLIFIGSSSAFIYSLYGSILLDTTDFHHYLFFETSASIITLVLLGNFLEKRAVKNTTSSLKDLQNLQVKSATLIAKDGNTISINSADIKKEDCLLIKQGESIPTDGIVLNGSGNVNESLLTGESEPILKDNSCRVIAGSILIDGTLEIKALSNTENNTISQIEKLVVQAQENQPSIQKIGDKVSSVFIPIVLCISAFTFIASWQFASLGIQQSMLSAIAVLVISCPCAMGLATPTAVMVGIGKLAKNGALIKSGDSLEKIATADTFIFDKTGTLTNGNFKITKIVTHQDLSSQQCNSILKSLETHSNHPIAKSIVNQLAVSKKIKLQSIKESKGISISGKDNEDSIWTLGSDRILNQSVESNANLFLTKNHSLAAEIWIEDEIKEDAATLINYLKATNKRIILLSGDKKEKCIAVAKALGIDEYHYRMLPDEKLALVRKLTSNQNTVMLGDGINDAPALCSAQVGISFGEATDIAQNSAEVIVLGKDNLNKVIQVIQASKETYKTIKQNLFWALAYNVIAIPVAAIGLLSPIIAAGSMAFSDLVVIGNSLRIKYKTAK